jgi:hypothetical protein
MNIASPCTDVCKLDSHGICLGCFRKKEEIANWLQMTDREKFLVFVALDGRREKSTQIYCGEIS